MNIVDSEKELNEILTKLHTSNVMVVPVYSNNYVHTRLQPVCMFWLHFLEEKSDYIILTNHSESLYKIESDLIYSYFNRNNYKFILNYKDLLFKVNNFIVNGIDIEILQYLDSGLKLSLPSFKCLEQYNSVYPRYPKLNEIIPVAKWIEYFEQIKPTLLNIVHNYNPLDRAYKYYNETVIPSIAIIEKNGLKVSLDSVPKNIMKSVNVDKVTDIMYSQYNIITTTGRPSNRYNTINFAALNKDSNIREMFISRYSPGILLEFDFESYHLRIIANLIDYTFPIGVPVHEYLGKQYFDTDVLTDSQYEESKQISFRQLYGGIQSEYLHIAFFKKTDILIQSLWDQWKRSGYIESPISGRKLYKKNYPALNAQKLFNYYIQLLETEINMDKISKINEFLKTYNTKLVMYVYDSFLFDFDFKDTKSCVLGIQRILEEGGYVVRKYRGPTYNDLKEILT